MKKFLLCIVAWGMIIQTFPSTQSALTEDQLVAVLVDLELAKAMIDSSKNDNQAEADILFQEQAALIYNAHAIDSVIFQKNYTTYLMDPLHLQAVYDQVIIRLEKMLQESS